MLNWRLLRDWIEPRFQACLAFLPWLIELLKSWRSLPSNLEWSTVTVCDMFCMGYHYFLTLKIDGCCVWQAFAGRSLLSNPEGSTVTVRQALHGRSLPSSPERLCVVCDRPGMGDCCLLTLNDVLCVVCDRPGMGLLPSNPERCTVCCVWQAWHGRLLPSNPERSTVTVS